MTDSRPNILLIVMDTARAQTVLDNEAVMPNFHEFASEGTLFTNAFSTAPWTLPSHASMFTGQYTSDHGTHAGNKAFDPDVPTVAEELQDTGYQTVGFSNNVWISPEFGFDRGFDKLRTSIQLVEGGADVGSIAKENDGIGEQALAVSKSLLRRDGLRTLINGIYSKLFRGKYDNGARVTNWRIKRWLSKYRNQESPFFMFVNYLEPHLEYDPPDEFKYKFLPDELTRSDLATVNQDAWSYICDQAEMDDQDFEALSALYQAELNYLDYRLGELFELIKKKNILDDTMVVIVGDHGENLGDHDLMDHQYCLYDTLLHIPLLVRYPDEFPAGERCAELVELRDLFPTLLAAAGVNTPKNRTVSSRSLHETLDTVGRDRVHAEYLTPQPSMEALEERTGVVPKDVREYERRLRSVRSREWKFICGSDGSVELYDVRAEETTDVADEHPDRTAELQTHLNEMFDKFEINPQKEAENIKTVTQARLEDLGYL